MRSKQDADNLKQTPLGKGPFPETIKSEHIAEYAKSKRDSTENTRELSVRITRA